MPRHTPSQGQHPTGVEPDRGLVAKPPARPKLPSSPLFAGKQRPWPKRKIKRLRTRADPEALGFIGGDANASTPRRPTEG